MNVLLYILLAFILYKFITGFLIPVIRTGRRIRREFRRMQDQMNAQAGFDNTAPQQPSDMPNREKGKVGEYIDFEEVK